MGLKLIDSLDNIVNEKCNKYVSYSIIPIIDICEENKENALELLQSSLICGYNKIITKTNNDIIIQLRLKDNTGRFVCTEYMILYYLKDHLNLFINKIINKYIKFRVTKICYGYL